jgi:hypothetical protein
MHAIADTTKLVADGIITQDQAAEIETRARTAMVTLGINTLLCLGIFASTAGLILFLADAVSVAVFGLAALATGTAILARGGEMFRIFGNAAALIGAGMLLGGGTVELFEQLEDDAPGVLAMVGAVVAVVAGTAFRVSPTGRFVAGAILVLGVAIHLGGLGLYLFEIGSGGAVPVLFYLWAALLTAATGWMVDVRFVTALAIAPFAQALDTGTVYFHAAYVFYSPEPTLTILQMSALVAVSIWGACRLAERDARHLRVTAVMGFIVANLCALVGSLWGDVIGETVWGPGSYRDSTVEYEAWQASVDAFRVNALTIPESIYAILWAVALVAAILWSAQRNNRGLFNAALTFGGIHAYTQLFESFGDEPLAWVIGGLAAIPLAWGVWWLNRNLLVAPK